MPFVVAAAAWFLHLRHAVLGNKIKQADTFRDMKIGPGLCGKDSIPVGLIGDIVKEIDGWEAGSNNPVCVGQFHMDSIGLVQAQLSRTESR